MEHSGNSDEFDVSDRDALAKQLESYRPWCRVFVRQLLYAPMAKRVDESDIIQSTWLDVLRKADQFRGSSQKEFFGWLKTSLQNHVRNEIRAQTAGKRDVRLEQDGAFDMDTATIHWLEPRANGGSPSDHVIQGESALAVANALERLPKNQRKAIELRHLQGVRLRDVAADMGKSPDAVVALIRRGMETLEALLPTSGQS